MTEAKLVIVGGGRMGEAMLAGWLASRDVPADVLNPENFVVVEPTEARRAYLVERYAASCVASVAQVKKADFVVLAVKPQVIMEVLQEIAQNHAFVGALFVSVAAGVTAARLQSGLPAEARLVRTMPNTPLLVGKGVTAVCGGRYATADDVDEVHDMFSCLGFSCIVEEEMMDAVCAVSGSGPAYVCAIIEAVTRAGVELGLSESLAEQLFLATVAGTAALIRETGQTPVEVRTAVSSPGGTTLAGLDAMSKAGLDRALERGVKAAASRSKELGTC